MKPPDWACPEPMKKGRDAGWRRGPFLCVLGRMVSRQGKAVLALQHGNLRQFAGLFGQVAANGADHPGELIGRVQLLVGDRALDLLAFAVAQGQQDTAVRAWLSGDVVLGEY